MNLPGIAAGLALALAACGAPARAQSSAPSGRPSSAASATSMATGEVLEIDRKEGRVLVKHGPIASIGMDAMTMEFLVPDPAPLKQLRAGDQIRFSVVWRKGEYEITSAQVTGRKAVAP
jgi:Cu(I)/Ag(I) efflux system periplasmic protein CusF